MEPSNTIINGKVIRKETLLDIKMEKSVLENLLREVLEALSTAIPAMFAIEVSVTDACIYVAGTVFSKEAFWWLIAPLIITWLPAL